MVGGERVCPSCSEMLLVFALDIFHLASYKYEFLRGSTIGFVRQDHEGVPSFLSGSPVPG